MPLSNQIRGNQREIVRVSKQEIANYCESTKLVKVVKKTFTYIPPYPIISYNHVILTEAMDDLVLEKYGFN